MSKQGQRQLWPVQQLKLLLVITANEQATCVVHVTMPQDIDTQQIQ